MKKKIITITIVGILPLLSAVFCLSCHGKKEVKQVSPESKISTEAFALVEAIRNAYVRKDFSAVSDLATREGYKEFVDSVRHFDTAELAFTPKMVEIDKAKVYVNVAWYGTWLVGTNAARERGMAVFLLEGPPLKLGKILRGNPFRYPESAP